MKELKSMDLKLLWELVKNSRRSDRTLAKVLKSSQPTVTRRRAKLEKEVIAGYTAIPKWEKIGFNIIAFTFVKTKIKYAEHEEIKAEIQKAKEWFMKQPNVIFVIKLPGMEWDGVSISLHKNYLDFTKFITRHDSELSSGIDESRSYVANMNPELILKMFHFKYLANAE